MAAGQRQRTPMTTATTGAARARSHSARGMVHESSHNESIEWYTPPEIFDALGLVFDLDPCSPGAGLSFVPARRHLTEADDGLATPWSGTTFVNPPYGPHTPVWMRKLAEHGNGIGLVFARTDTRWFHDVAPAADVVCFVSSRIRFFQGSTERRGGSPGAGSMLLAYGRRCADAVLASGLGACFEYLPGQQAAELAS